MTLTADQQRRMQHVNPERMEQDDYEYVMGKGSTMATQTVDAAYVLTRYLRSVHTAAGLEWDEYDDEKIEAIVAAIRVPFEARIADLEQRVETLAEVVYRLEGK